MIVVTGADGFLGSAVMAGLAARGHALRGLVRTLDASTVARPEYLAVGDLARVGDETLRNALRGASAVVHLAAQAHRPLDADIESAAALRRVNVEASERLASATAAAGARHFVFVSTVKVHGDRSLPGRPLRESDPPHPPDEYAASKWAAERALAIVAERTALCVTALRLPLVYGPGVKANFAALARAVARGVPLPLAAVANKRSVLGTGNFVSALAALLASDGAGRHGQLTPYFVTDAESVSTPDLVRALSQAFRVAPRLFPFPASALRIAGAWLGKSETVERLLDTLEADATTFRTHYAWTPPYSLAQGVAAMLADRPPL
ncbi:MAG TPA: NAD-dependent epimerase/dehydratase family protein [Casimicrobiaceae bacterium]|nr:NAD-dependent epimerase/dehydratase family protein [Casimicrobiaceae bacterium]